MNKGPYFINIYEGPTINGPLEPVHWCHLKSIPYSNRREADVYAHTGIRAIYRLVVRLK